MKRYQARRRQQASHRNLKNTLEEHQAPLERKVVSGRTENVYSWFSHLHSAVQIVLILCATIFLILLLLNPVAGGALISYLLALKGIKGSPFIQRKMSEEANIF